MQLSPLGVLAVLQFLAAYQSISFRRYGATLSTSSDNASRQIAPAKRSKLLDRIVRTKPRTKLARNSRGGHKSAKSNHPLPTVLSTIHPLFHPFRDLPPSSRVTPLYPRSLSLPPNSPCLDMSTGTELHSTPRYYDV